MSRTVTLELSDAVLQRATEAAGREGRPVEEILAAWMELAVVMGEVGGSARPREYTLCTPDVDPASVMALHQFIREAEARETEPDEGP